MTDCALKNGVFISVSRKVLLSPLIVMRHNDWLHVVAFALNSLTTSTETQRDRKNTIPTVLIGVLTKKMQQDTKRTRYDF